MARITSYNVCYTKLLRITRFLLREFSKIAAAATAGFLLLFIVIDFVEHADEFLKYQTPAGEVFRYYP